MWMKNWSIVILYAWVAWSSRMIWWKSEGLGIRCDVHLALSAILASVAGCAKGLSLPYYHPFGIVHAITWVSEGHNNPLPLSPLEPYHICRSRGISQRFLQLRLNSLPLPLMPCPKPGFYLPPEKNLVPGCIPYRLHPLAFAWSVTLFA